MGSQIQKSEGAVKRLHQLVPNLVHVQIHLGMDIRQTNCPSRHKGGAWGFLGVKHSTVYGSCQTAAPIGTKFGTRRRLRLGMDIG